MRIRNLHEFEKALSRDFSADDIWLLYSTFGCSAQEYRQAITSAIAKGKTSDTLPTFVFQHMAAPTSGLLFLDHQQLHRTKQNLSKEDAEILTDLGVKFSVATTQGAKRSLQAEFCVLDDEGRAAKRPRIDGKR